MLTPDQEVALKGILKFITSKETAAILYAAAGCGKTYLTRVIVDRLRTSKSIAGVAPTHKAKKVLDNFLNKGCLLKVKTMTIASLLNKMRSHTYIGTKHYVKGADTKIHLFDLFLIDEASMITDSDVSLIINYAEKLNKKILFIGDRYQIPNPSQKYICKDGMATKRDSIAFDLSTKFQLTTNVRQGCDASIIEIYNEIRDAIDELRDPVIDREKCSEFIRHFTETKPWYSAFEDLIKSKVDLHMTRIIAYTNDSVHSHNLAVRRMLKYEAPIVKGELLMGYANLGWPEKIIENSQDYYVVAIKETFGHLLTVGSKDYTLIGLEVLIKETDTDHTSEIFVPDLRAPQNMPLLEELVRRAEKVNKRGSTKADFKKYCAIKNKLVFMENIYKYGGKIVGAGEFRVENPLLFKSVRDMIVDEDEGERKILNNKLVKDISTKYGDILEDRIGDDKPLAGTERLCDRYCVIEKDIDYGYAITSHKSQGSNFTTVFIDEADFDKLGDYWSYILDCQVCGTKEANQLKYVAYTRPTTSAFVLYR